MIDNKNESSNISPVANNDPALILENCIDIIKEIKKDGFLTLSAGFDEKGDKRIFTPFWSLILSTFSCVTLFIIILVSGFCVWLRLLGERVYYVITLACNKITGLIALPIACLILIFISKENKVTTFGLKFTKA